MHRTCLVNALLAVVSVSLTLALAEGVCRLTWHPAVRHLKGPTPLYRYDPLLGWRLRPSVTFERRTDEYAVVERTNSFGLRCPEVPVERSDGTLRLMILGDSFAEGTSVDWEQTCAARSGIKLAERTGQRVDVVNGGCAGWSTDQQLLWFRTEGHRWRPDVTVLLFYDNDIWYNTQERYWRGYKPRFALVDGTLHLAYRPVRPSPSDGSEGGWLQEFVLAQFLADRLSHTHWLRHLAPFAEAKPPSFADEFRRYEAGDATTRDGWRLTEALLAALRDEVSATGSRFLVLVVPPRWAVYDDYRPRLVRAYGPAAASWDFTAPTNEVAAVCRRLVIDCIDPTERFRTAAERLYFMEDGHWNVAGHELASELLADAMAP